MKYWFDIPQWIPALICLLILLGLNLLTVKIFGELSFVALIKVVTILALIVIGVGSAGDWVQNAYRNGFSGESVGARRLVP